MTEPDYEEFSSYSNFVSIHALHRSVLSVNNFTLFQLSCSNVQELEYEDRCEYVRSTPECMDKQYFFNYIEILYCSLRPTSNSQENCFLILLMSMCVVMFLILGTTADKLFVSYSMTRERLSKPDRTSNFVVFVRLWRCCRKSWV